MNQFSRLELITLEITKAIVTNVGPNHYCNPKDLVDRAENIALALYSRFEENNSNEEYVS